MVRSMIRPVLLAVLAATALLARPVSAQVTDADLVRENERLVAEVRDLEAALEAALQRIAALETELATLRSGGTTAAAPAKPATAPTPPKDSAEGMIQAIKAAHAKAVEDGEIEYSGDVRQMRQLAKWTAAAGRTFRTPIEWPVVVLDSSVSSPSDGTLEVQVWDPATNAVTGDPFVVAVPRRVVERVNRSKSNREDGPVVFTLNGVFTPDIRVNQNRLEVGPFDKPRFVGPMVEMAWSVDVRGVGEWKAPEATAVADDD